MFFSFKLLLDENMGRVNEVDILPLARQYADPTWIPDDWYLNQPPGYRMLFLALFGLLASNWGFLATSLIASLAEEANNLPTFAQRSILVGREYAIPYQLGYYRQFRQRTLELINAQYSPNLTAAKNLIHKYKIDFWLLDKAAFTPEYIANNSWLKQYQPATAEAITLLQQKKNQPYLN